MTLSLGTVVDGAMPRVAEPAPPPIPGFGPSELEPGTYYRPGAQVRASRDGVMFTLPPPWFGKMPHGSSTLYLESAEEAGLGLIAPLQHVTPEEMEEHLNEPQVIDEGYVLQPAGSAQRSNRRIRARYHRGQQTGVAVALFGDHGRGILFLFTGPQEKRDRYEDLLEQLAESTEFFPPSTEDEESRHPT